ncbi:uncharacterized protein LOC129348770 [Amphiprion ocellaris]|uniref:uncharacterized protein LOC129348770 n=1 Tax=Amphiprion ocellaris TaxID=80972 RepID=UPI0024119677|nr:uncharacterized protein LOC129348770 [Amphiprion ocellaris]
MDVQIAFSLLCLLLFSELFKSASGDPFSHGSIVYSREQLLALSQARPPSWERPDIPAELRRRRRGCRAGLKRREKRRRYKPSVPSVIMGNVRSLPNKMEELTALTRLQWEYRESSLMMFTESWLNELTPDSLLTLDGFHLVRADRNARESGKRKGGGLAMYVNERWCNAGHISVKEQLCTKDVELLAVSLRPFYLPREYSHVIAITVYIPPSADAAAACELIHSVVSQLQTSHPQSLIIISGDFNHASLSATLPTFTQYVTCHTRDNKTLDLLYANIKDAYSSSPLPPLGHSDHNLVRLQPIYIPMVKKQPPTIRYVKKWSDEATEALQDCFETTDWDVLCGPHGEDIDALTDTVTDYINFCAENIVPTRKVRCFSNSKPWVSLELKALLKEKRRVFGSGDKEELRRVQKEIKKKIKADKASYRTKMESHLQDNNTREVWRDLRSISGYSRGHERGAAAGGQEWANELNLFFNRFDSAPTPPPSHQSTDQPAPSSHLSSLPPPPPTAPLLPSPSSTTSGLRIQPHHPSSSHPPPPPSPLLLPPSPCLSITADQVRSELKKIKTRKAAGPDGISSRLLRDCADQLCQVLLHIFNLSLSLERVPLLWKTSCLVPVSKTRNPREPNHFRPVALTSHLMKTMERIVLKNLRPQVSQYLDPLQFAYQPNIGVDDAVVYLLHRSLTHLENPSSTVRVMFFDFSSAFNTIQPSLLRVKLEGAGVDCHLAAWTIDYLTNRPQYVRLQDCVSDVVVSSMGAPQGTVLSPFLFTLYTSDFHYNSGSCHLQKFSDDTAIVGCVSEGDEREYRMVISDFVDWCEQNHLQLNASKTKEMIVDFRRRRTPRTAPVNIQGLDIDMVDTYKYLGVHLNNKLDWTHNTEVLYKKGQSRLHLLRRLRSFGVCRTLLRTFYDSVVASAIFYAVVCWGAGSTERDRKRLNRLVRRAGSVLDCSLDSIEEVGERRMLSKLTSIMDNPSHPLHDTVGSLSSSFSSRLRHPPCKKERYRRSFIPSAIRLYNISITG